MLKTLLLFLLPILVSLPGYSQSTSRFADPTGNFSTTSSGICFACSFSNTANVADMSSSNYATVTIAGGLAASRGIRAKLNSLSPGNTYAGFYINIGAVVSALPSVTLSTYKNGSLRQTVVTNGNIVTLLGGYAGYISGLTNSLDYDEVGISLNGGIATVGMTAQVYYAIGGMSSPLLFVLPVKFTSVAVTLKNNQPQLEWSASGDENAVYEIQRSYDGADFTTIAERISNQTGENSFSFTDNTATQSMVYYRVSVKPGNGGAASYSKTVSIRLHPYQGVISIFPNPVRDNSFTIIHDELAGQAAILQLFNTSGKLVYTERIITNKQNQVIRLSHSLQPGIYFVSLQTEKHKSSPQKFIVQ